MSAPIGDEWRVRLLCDSGACVGDGTECANDGRCTAGLLQVRRLGQSWGTVCDDGFTYSATSAVCRYLGFQTYDRYWSRGDSMPHATDVSILMDDVTCAYDATWAECTYNP